MNERYRMENPIGTGANGTVYKAFDNHLQRWVAIKRLTKEENWALEEAKILKKLRHPCIPMIYDMLKQDNDLFLVMEYMEGDNLLTLLEQGIAFTEEQAVQLSIAIGECLQYLHQLPEKIIYRDLKPANLLVDGHYNIRLIDFDSAFLGRANEETNIYALKNRKTGTYGYSAPEQFEREGMVDERSDIYAFGMTIYHLFTGKNPSRPPYYMRSVIQSDTFLHKSICRIIEKCVEKEREKRYENMEQVLADLRHYKEKKGKYGGCKNMIKSVFSSIVHPKNYGVIEKKSVLLTAKKTGGLFLLLFVLGVIGVSLLPKNIVKATPSDVLPLVLYNDKREKIIVKDGTFYESKGAFHMALPEALLSERKEVEITVICKDLQTGEKLEKVVLLRRK